MYLLGNARLCWHNKQPQILIVPNDMFIFDAHYVLIMGSLGALLHIFSLLGPA